MTTPTRPIDLRGSWHDFSIAPTWDEVNTPGQTSPKSRNRSMAWEGTVCTGGKLVVAADSSLAVVQRGSKSFRTEKLGSSPTRWLRMDSLCAPDHREITIGQPSKDTQNGSVVTRTDHKVPAPLRFSMICAWRSSSDRPARGAQLIPRWLMARISRRFRHGYGENLWGYWQRIGHRLTQIHAHPFSLQGRSPEGFQHPDIKDLIFKAFSTARALRVMPAPERSTDPPGPGSGRLDQGGD